MDRRGANPLVAIMVLMAGFAVFFILFAFFSEPLYEIWSTTEGTATNPERPPVETALRFVWALIAVLVVVFIVVWFFARLFMREREVEVFVGR